MNIIPGVNYKNRAGDPVRIYAIDGGGDKPIHGAFLDPKSGWDLMDWRADGTFMLDGKESLLDIVAVSLPYPASRRSTVS